MRRAKNGGPRLGTYLLVELDKSGLELLGDVLAGVVVLEDVLTEALAGLVLFADKLCLNGSGEGVQRHFLVFGISNLLKLDVRDFLVVDQGWVMSWNVSWKFWEIGSHCFIDSQIVVERQMHRFLLSLFYSLYNDDLILKLIFKNAALIFI